MGYSVALVLLCCLDNITQIVSVKRSEKTKQKTLKNFKGKNGRTRGNLNKFANFT